MKCAWPRCVVPFPRASVTSTVPYCFPQPLPRVKIRHELEHGYTSMQMRLTGCINNRYWWRTSVGERHKAKGFFGYSCLPGIIEFRLDFFRQILFTLCMYMD